MKKTLVTLALASALISTAASAHPGRTASDGCHYCRTNCDKWGEAQGARHCHGGGLKVETGVNVMELSAATKLPSSPTNGFDHTSDAAHEHAHVHSDQQYN